MMYGDARALERALAWRAEDQVHRVESPLRRLALVRAQVVRQPHHARGLADVAEDSVLELLRDILVGKGKDRHLDDREGTAVHAIRQVGVKGDALLVLEPVVLLEHGPDRL